MAGERPASAIEVVKIESDTSVGIDKAEENVPDSATEGLRKYVPGTATEELSRVTWPGMLEFETSSDTARLARIDLGGIVRKEIYVI